MSAKLPRPCKHSGTSWGLESAESLPAGDLEMGQIKGMRNERGGWETEAVFTQRGSAGVSKVLAKGASGSGKI